ncbi:c6 zinc finger domain-containing protein [Thelonectria olida]|uniref:C6 zinc finger domain-containing protein n=1 Tax=Thelonectria olida TaxID=1576542 RepID=A0A9P8VT71_9HYPO|nr:c6 zinc finger domain-containing protein [Thelonectria olida]
MQACDRCHARKTRCDRRIPQCSACEKAGVPCVHADKLRQRNLPRAYLDNIESLVKQLREENKLLRESLASTQAEIRARNQAASELSALHADSRSPSRPVQARDDTDAMSKSTGSPESNAFAVEVGYLTLIATGETRYLGSSSGLGLANIINTVINVNGGMGPMHVDQHDLTSSSIQRIPMGPSDSLFPSLATAKTFIEAYFQHTHISFPLLHRPSFLAIVDRIYSEPNFYEANPFDAFVFDMVLTIGSSNFNRFEDKSVNSSVYFTMAQSKITTIATRPSLESLKVVLLISQHGIFSNLRETNASIWHLTGLGARMCFELGLHLERKHPERDLANPPQPHQVSLEEEMRKRCFWCLYNLDRIVSITLGRPVIIRDEEIDVTMPSHLDDDFFGVDQPIQVHAPMSSEPSEISPFLHLIRIRRLSGQILSQMYIFRRHSHIPLEEKRCLRCRLHGEVNAWRQDTERLHLPSMESRGYMSSFLSKEWYTAVYNNAILLLYRPSPYLPEPTMASSCDDGKPELMCLLNAAKASIESYSELHRKRRLNYSWITLHGIFIAGLAYIYSVGRLLDNPTTRRHVPNIMCVIEVTQACSHVLVAICERWNGSRRSCELFSELSTNLIRDALNVAPRPNDDAQSRGGSDPSQATHNEPSAPAAQNQSAGMGGAQMNSDESQMELGIVDSTAELENILVMENFKEFSGFFDFTFQNDYLSSGATMSSFSQNWPFDLPFSPEGEVESSQVS